MRNGRPALSARREASGQDDLQIAYFPLDFQDGVAHGETIVDSPL